MGKNKSNKYMSLKALIVAIAVIGIVAYFILTAPTLALASDYLNLPDGINFGGVPEPVGADAVEKSRNMIGRVMAPLRVIMGAVAVALMVLYGFLLVIGGRNEESINTQKKAVLWGIIGLAIISGSASIGEIFDFTQGSFLGDEQSIAARAGLFDSRVMVIVTFLKYTLGSIAIFAIIKSGLIMIMASGSEENVKREQKNLIGGFVAIFMVIISDHLVRNIIFNVTMSESENMAVVSINATAGMEEIAAVTNFMVSFIGPIMILGIIGGSVMYVLAASDEEKTQKAQKIIMNSVIGALVIYGAYAVVTAAITGSLF